MRAQSAGVLVAAAIAAYALYSPMQAFEHGQISAMPQTCQSRMNDIFDSYYNITVLDGTLNCTDIILSNLNNANGVNCTKPEDVRACFNVSVATVALMGFLVHAESLKQACSCLQWVLMPMSYLGHLFLSSPQVAVASSAQSDGERWVCSMSLGHGSYLFGIASSSQRPHPAFRVAPQSAPSLWPQTRGGCTSWAPCGAPTHTTTEQGWSPTMGRGGSHMQRRKER